MRPNRPGHWWYQCIFLEREQVVCVKVTNWSGGGLVVWDYGEPLTVQQFEKRKHIRFQKWIGQAHPPKKVRRIKVDVVKELLSGYRNAVEVYYGTKEDDHGDLVKYDDVKEFLLEEKE